MLMALCSCAVLSAQDRIYFFDSRVVDAIVDEVGEEVIYYRMFDNQYGPVYSVSPYSLVKIVYQNGTEQNFGYAAYDPAYLGAAAGSMRYVKGKLYIGSQTPLGQMQAEQVAFNLYGDKYYKARNRMTTGSTLLWICGTSLAVGLVGFASDGEPQGFGLLTGIGVAGVAAGIPIYCSGKNMLKGIADDYNSKRQTTLTVGPCRSGLGLALNF